MLFERVLDTGVPIVPGVAARKFMVGMRDTTFHEKGMVAPILIEQMVIGATVKRESWHRRWVKRIDERIAIERIRSAGPVPVFGQAICLWKAS